jgi:hypothetical protein
MPEDRPDLAQVMDRGAQPQTGFGAGLPPGPVLEQTGITMDQMPSDCRFRVTGCGHGPPLGRRPRRRPAGHDIPAAERHLTDMDALDQLLKEIPRPVEPFEASHIGSMQHSHLHVHGHH